MSKIPYRLVNTWQEAREIHPDRPVVLVWVCGTGNHYMRYRGEFHKIDSGSYVSSYVSSTGRQWSIAGVCSNNDSITWMLNNSIAYPFTREDLVLYQLTWDIVHG